MTQIETHVFGSKDGYETLAHSSGLTSIELAELDGLGFGQSSDPGVLAQLSTSPTALGRFLSSGRFAITRCVQGPPDDAGRATFRLLSIVMDAHDYLSDVRHRLSSLLADQALWDVDRFSHQKSLRGRSGAPSPRDARTSAIAGQWAAATGSTRTACFVDESDGDQLVLRVASELPEIAAQQLSWGVRLFSAGTQATLFTTVPGVSLSASRKIVRVRVAVGSPALDPQRFGQATPDGERPVPRSPMRFARNPLVLSAVATLIILMVGFWPSGSQQTSRQPLARSSGGVQNRAFDPSQRTLSVAPRQPAPESKPNPEAKSETNPADSSGKPPENQKKDDTGSVSGEEQKPGETGDEPPSGEQQDLPDLESDPADSSGNLREDPIKDNTGSASGEDLNLDPNNSGASEGVSNGDWEEWEAALKSFKAKIVKVKESLQAVAQADFGSVEKSSGEIICTESSSLIPKLSHFQNAVEELGDWTFVEEKTGVTDDGKVVVITNGDEYDKDKKFRVMAVLHLWKEFQPTQFPRLYNTAKTSGKRLASLIDKAAGEFGAQPSMDLLIIRTYIEELFGNKSQHAFFNLLDRSLGAEGDLFLWVNSYQTKTYEELVEISKKDHGGKEDRRPPNPGLLLDELPCKGGIR